MVSSGIAPVLTRLTLTEPTLFSVVSNTCEILYLTLNVLFARLCLAEPVL